MSKKPKQLQFGGDAFQKPKLFFGGALLKNSHAKTLRPLEPKLPIHLVLRATKGGMRLPKTFLKVNATVTRISKKHGVRLYKYVNVGNHLHLLIKIPHRNRWSAFIRELTGQVAQVAQGLTGSETGAEKFWKQRPYTRIVGGWKKAFQIVKDYLELNCLEAEGYISRKDTKTLKDLRAIWQDF